MAESWRPVVGYEPLYDVSDRGRDRSLARIEPHVRGTRPTGRAFAQTNGYTLHYDRSSRCAVIFDPQVGEVITAYRLRKSQIKRHYSR